MIFLLGLIVSFKSFAGFSEVNGDDLYNYQEKEVVQTVKRKSSALKKAMKKDDKLLKQLLEQDQKISSLLESQRKSLIVRKADTKILPLTRVRGILLNSVLAMNVVQSTSIIRLGNDNPDLEGGEIRCKSMSFQKRVNGICDLLVLDGESFDIDARLWDLDGAEGLIADYFYSGEEKSFLTSSLSSFFASMLEGAKSKISTPFGEVTKGTSQNQLLNGLMGVANNVNQKISESGERKIEISYVNSGKKALIFFNSSLNLSKDKSNE